MSRQTSDKITMLPTKGLSQVSGDARLEFLIAALREQHERADETATAADARETPAGKNE